MNWIKRIFNRRRLYADLSEEIEQHLQEKIDDLIEQGLPREEATAVARREFGNVMLLEERSREVWQWPSLESLFSDLRYALRQLRRSPSFALVTVLTLALGIGANTVVFSVVNAVLLQPLPFAKPDRLVSVQPLNTQQAARPSSLSYPNFFDFRTQNQVFDNIVCYRDGSVTLSTSDRAVHVHGQIVSWDLFPLLGIPLLLGRGFLPEEEAPGTRVVVLSHQLWQREFGADPNIVGRSITLSGQPFTVVGVAPADFRFPIWDESVQLWTTIAIDATSFSERGARMLKAIARLRPGVTLELARAQMDMIAGALAKQYPDNINHRRVQIQPELENLVGDTRKPLIILMGAVALVLLIACANVANLMLVRTAEREREFALRASIGASRLRVIRQLLTEGLVLATIGGIAGVLFAAACMDLLPLVGENIPIPRIGQAGIDGNVLIFTMSLVLFTCVFFSLSPARQVVKAELAGHLKAGTRSIAQGRDRFRGALVVGQIALSLTLLSGAVLLIASLIHLMQRDPGFRSDHGLRFSLSLPSGYGQPEQINFYERLLDRLSNLPGVTSAAGGGPLPLTGSQMNIAFNIPERPVSASEKRRSDCAIVTPGYFATMGIPLLKGRDFTQGDDAGSPPVVIVNEAFANRFFPGEDAVGKAIQSGAGSRPGEPPISRRIVGIVGNAKQSSLSSNPEPIYYFPFKQLPWWVDSVVLRTAVSPLAVLSAARAEVASIDKEVSMYRIGTMDELQSAAIASARFLTLLLASFAGVALILSVVGLYGVVSHSVTKRTHEIGVRLALGANRSSVLTMVLKQAMTLVGIGLIIGLAGAVAGVEILRSILHGANPHTPLLLAVACCMITAAAIIAAYLPARRAALIEPMQALRRE